MNIGSKKIIFGTTTAILIASINAFAISANLGGNIVSALQIKMLIPGLRCKDTEVDAAPNIAVRGAMIYYDSDIKVDVLSERLYNVRTGPVCFKTSMQTNSSIHRLGWHMAEHNLSGRVVILSAVGHSDEDINSDIGLRNGGVNVILASNFSLDFNVKYIYFKPEAELSYQPLRFSVCYCQGRRCFSALFLTAGLVLLIITDTPCRSPFGISSLHSCSPS